MKKEIKKKKNMSISDDEDIFEMTKTPSKKTKITVVESSESSDNEVDGMIPNSQLRKNKYSK